MTRILIFLAMASACSVVPALAQVGTARPPSDPGTAAPAKPDEEDVLEGLVKGIVKAVVEEAQKPTEQVPPPPAESGAAPADPAPLPQAVPVAASAPQPQSAAAGAPPRAAPAKPELPVASAEPKLEQPPEPALVPPEVLSAPEPAVQPPGPSAEVSTVAATWPTPAIAEPTTDQPGRFWLLAPLLLVAAAVAAAAMHRARVIRTKRLLSLEPRLDVGLDAASATAFDFAAPPVSIRCRLEKGAVHG